MEQNDPAEPWPPRYPVGSEQQASWPRYPGQGEQGPASPESAAGRTWRIAGACGVVTFIGLLVVHLSADGTGSAAYRAGEMVPIAAGSAVLVALMAGGTGRARRGWPWWAMALSTVAMSSLWYLVAEVAPRVENDVRAEESGQADYVLHAPKRAGDWQLLTGADATTRREQALSLFEQAPEEARRGLEPVFGEYVNSEGVRVYFIGLNVSGAAADEIRESSSSALRNFMAGFGVTNAGTVDAGELGGSMACTADAAALPDGLVLCAWADASTLAQLQLYLDEADMDRAADLTKQFRAEVTLR